MTSVLIETSWLLTTTTALPVLPAAIGSLASVQLFVGAAPLAYIGPGAGLGAIGALIAVAGAILLGLLGLILYPYHLLRNRLRNRQRSTACESPDRANP